jgi:hypothetical protein
MPLLISSIIGGIVSALGTLVGRVLISLGIGYVTFTGVDASFEWAKAQFLGGLSGLPAGAVGLMGLLKVGVCVSMLLSALTTRLVISGLTSGTIKRMVTK